MKDLEYIKLLKKLKNELHRRYSKEICEELHNDCHDCRIRIMIGEINSQIDLNNDQT